MGVTGLTSYIAKNAEKYLEPFELHDCKLVIDGDSLSSNLYKWTSQCNSAFGGDYDQYFRSVVNFFTMLSKCKIEPYVLLDGGYLRKKLRTVRSRLRSKIGLVKHINPFNCTPLFPLMMREVFVEALRFCEVPVMRCVFEADDEVAVLARKLNCPVLSYDSDFYIHNVQYIPMITVTMKIHTKKRQKKNRRKPAQSREYQTYSYLDCCIYTIKNLVKNEISDDMLPLFATLLGNDYINRSAFREFYANFSLKHCGKRNSRQQRRIIAVLRWLKHETLESAKLKILQKLPQEGRAHVLKKIDLAMCGYNQETCEALSFFKFSSNSGGSKIDVLKHVNDGDIGENIKEKSVETVEDISKCNEDFEFDSDAVSINSENDSDLENKNNSGNDNSSENEGKSENEDNSENENDLENRVENEEYTNLDEKSYKPPDWLYNKIINAELPRFVVDLLFLKMYINSPQVENFILPDSNDITLPILSYIFTLIHYPLKPEFQYLTRVLRISNVHYKKLSCVDIDSEFDPMASSNASLFEFIFKNHANKKEMFELIGKLPEDLQLYYLAVAYWANNSQLVNATHIYSVMICQCVLYEADKRNTPVVRDKTVFLKKHAKLIENFERPAIIPKQQNQKETIESKDTYKTYMEVAESLTSKDSILLQYNSIQYFYLNNNIREKHTDFSSAIVHSFAELQATIFNINCLNTILNNPYKTIQLSKFFNGTFLYNMYVNLKDRSNVLDYIRRFVFKENEKYYALWDILLSTCTPSIFCLQIQSIRKTKRSRNNRKNKKKPKSEAVNEVAEEIDETACKQSDNEFNDLNNKFSCLLKM